ncbi:MAG TPA: four helix bundle protein [Polyangiaceae bacterium]
MATQASRLEVRRGPPSSAAASRKSRSRPRPSECCARSDECSEERPTHRSFEVLDRSIQAIEVLRPVVARIRQCDRDLGEQLRRALSSVALNVAEGNSSEGGSRLSRFSTAAGSTSEARAALRVAVAWGYVSAPQVEAGERLLDGVAAMLHRLGARR